MLVLPIKKKWFDMIASGEKKEEYRELKPYYTTRFRNIWGYPAYWGEKHIVQFRNGYSLNSPTIEAECTLSTRASGRPEWGAEPDTRYYVLTIHRLVGFSVGGKKRC